jgi:hypothetical protein
MIERRHRMDGSLDIFSSFVAYPSYLVLSQTVMALCAICNHPFACFYFV